MNTRKVIAVVLFAIAAGLLSWWYSAGHHPWTSTEHMVTVTKTDPIFGTSVQTEQWVKEFTPGLEYLGPICGVAIVAGLWLMIRKPKAKA